MIKSNGNVKTSGVCHGYEIDDDNRCIWRKIIEKLKNCIHVWKSRKLTSTGKTPIVKTMILSLCAYQIEIRGIPYGTEK